MAEVAPAISANPLLRLPGVAIVLALLVVAFAIAAPGFLSRTKIANVLVQSTLLLLLSLPMTLVIMTEGLELSMGAVLTLTSIIVAIVSLDTGSMPLGLPGGGRSRNRIWSCKWIPCCRAEYPAVCRDARNPRHGARIVAVASDGQSVVGVPRSVSEVYLAAPFGVPLPIIIGLFAYLVFHGLLYHTRFGTYIFALGGNREALTYAGLSPSRLLIAVYAVSGAMAGVAGLLMTARMNAGHPTAGLGLEFDAIAAVAVGGTSFERGNGWLLGTVLGVLAVGVLRNGLNLLALPSSIQVASVGVLVIIAMFFDGLRSRS